MGTFCPAAPIMEVFPAFRASDAMTTWATYWEILGTKTLRVGLSGLVQRMEDNTVEVCGRHNHVDIA